MTIIYRQVDLDTRSISTDRRCYAGNVYDNQSTVIRFTIQKDGEEWDPQENGYRAFFVANVYDDCGNPFVYGTDTSPVFDGHQFPIPWELTSRLKSNRLEYQLWFVAVEVADSFDGTPGAMLTTQYLLTAVDSVAIKASCIKPAKSGCGCPPSYSPATSPSIIGPLEAIRSLGIIRPVVKRAHINDYGEEQGLDLTFKSMSGEYQDLWLNVPVLSDEGVIDSSALPIGNGAGRLPVLSTSIGDKQALMFSGEHGGFIGRYFGVKLEYVESEAETGKRHLVRLVDPRGVALSEIDLPMEELIKDSRWDAGSKEIVLVFDSGRELRIPMKDLVDIYTGADGQITVKKVTTIDSGVAETRYTIGIDPAYTQSIVADNRAVDAKITAHLGDFDNPHQVTKAQVGLGNADNTSDAGKPVSVAQRAAIDEVIALLDTNREELDIIDKRQNERLSVLETGLSALDTRESRITQDINRSLDERYTKKEADELLRAKQDVFTTGPNLSMAGNVLNVDLSDVKVAVDSALSNTSENPVQNKVVAREFDRKQNKLVQGDNITLMPNADGTVKVSASVPKGVTVDDSLSYLSENPVQNKVLMRALDEKADKGEGVGVWQGAQTAVGGNGEVVSNYLYDAGDVVVYDNALYISKVDRNFHHPSDEDCWAAVVGGAVNQPVGITLPTYVGVFGDEVNTEYVVTHNLGTRNIVMSFMTNDSLHEFVQPRVWASSLNTVTVKFTSPPGTNRMVVNIIKARSVNPAASQDFPLVVAVDTPAKTWSYSNETGCPLYAKAYDSSGNDIGGDIIQNSGSSFDPITVSFASAQKGSLFLASTTADLVYEVELNGTDPYVISGLTNSAGYLIQAFKDGEGQSRLDIIQEPGKVTIDASVPWKGFVALYPATGRKAFTASDLKSVTHDGSASYELTYQHNKGRAVGAQMYTDEGLGIVDMHIEPNVIKVYFNSPLSGTLYII